MNYVTNNVGASADQMKRFASDVIAGRQSSAVEQAVGCMKGAATGYQETLAIRGGFPYGGVAASTLYMATLCAIGAKGE